MTNLLAILLCLHLVTDFGSASHNDGYYKCDFTSSEDLCIFTLSATAPPNADDPDNWQGLGAVENEIPPTPCTAGYCQVEDLNGNALSLGPEPWRNGDNVVVTTTPNTGDDWTYSLIFELVAPLRNLMMYNPGDITADTWKLFTKAFVDCKVKDENEVGDNGVAHSVDNIYEIVKNAGGNDTVHHCVLQFLEEGALDLVCLATELKMDRCDTIRAKWELEEGTKCNCWMDAYNVLYGVQPDVDTDFTDCGAGETIDDTHEEVVEEEKPPHEEVVEEEKPKLRGRRALFY